MKKFNVFLGFLVVSFLVVITANVAARVSARDKPQEEAMVARGAQLYDDWSKVVPNAAVPGGNHPIWARQSNNTRSGADTWRCVSCHGWDYQGKEGAFRAGANATGFSGILQSTSLESDEIVSILSGVDDPQHDFSSLLTADDLSALAEFIRYGLLDDNQFIDIISRQVESGDLKNGEEKYSEACATCHGSDGTSLTFRYEGTDIALGTLALQDPWRFLHRTRFGTARAPEMPLGVDLGWTPQDSRDVLYFIQSNLPSGFESTETGPLEIKPVENEGGPAQNWITGVLTAFGAMATSLGFAVLVGALLVGIILLLVWLLRSRQS